MNQAELATRIALSQVEANKSELVAIPGSKKRIRIGFLHDYTVQKITELLLEREEMEEAAKGGDSNAVMHSAVKHPYFTIKMAAIAVLNSPIKIALFYPFKWRWWAFVRRYNEAQMASVTTAIQKKNNGVLHDVLSHYHVLDGYEDGLDEPDEGGSRAIPSRTHTGRIAAFVKDFPCYGDTRWIPFVGTITNYTARCVLTIPQVQIMQADLPHTLYKKDRKRRKKKAEPNANYRYNPSDKALRLQREANERMRKRMAAEGKEVQYSTDELFRKQ